MIRAHFCLLNALTYMNIESLTYKGFNNTNLKHNVFIFVISSQIERPNIGQNLYAKLIHIIFR